MATKKMDVPDIGNLLSTITKKRDSGEIPSTEIQRVGPAVPAQEAVIEAPKRQNVKTSKPQAKGPGGRPSFKLPDLEYVRVGSRIPKTLRKGAEQDLLDERYVDSDGRPIKTLDELVTVALAEYIRWDIKEGKRRK